MSLRNEPASLHLLTLEQDPRHHEQSVEPGARYRDFALTIDLDGPLKLSRFKRAWADTAAAIDALRMTMDEADPRLSLSGQRTPALALDKVDLGRLDEWLWARLALGPRPGDLPCEAWLVAVAPRRHVFCLFASSMVLDLPSAVYVVEDLAERYAGNIPASRAAFADYLTAHQAYRESPKAAADSEFWKDKLKAGAPPLQPYGIVRAAASGGVTRVWTTADPARSERLRALALSDGYRSENPGLDRAALIATAWAAFLHRVTGDRELLLGLPVREGGADFERSCGQLTNELPLRVAIEEHDTFASLARRIKALVEAALPHSRGCPTSSGLHLARVSLLPSFSTRFGDLDATARLLPAVAWVGPESMGGDESDTIGLVASDFVAGNLAVALDFHTATFPEQVRTRACAHFLRVLDGLIGDFDSASDAVDLLDDDERAEVLAAARGPEPSEPAADLVEQLALQARRVPDKLAIVGPDSSASYAELEARTNQMARLLRARGVAPGSRVGVAVARGVGEVVSLLGILKAGAAYVPVDPMHPADRVRVILEDAHLHALVTSSDSPILAAAPPNLATCFVDDLDATLAGIDSSPLGEPLLPEQAAYVLFTSGSTGRPKGVEVLRSGFANFLRSMVEAPGLDESDRLLAITTTTFDIAGLELFLPLYVGATVLVADRETALDPRRLRARLENESVTVMQATPATWRMLNDEGWQGNDRLRALCGGEALNRDLAGKLLARSAELWNLYGPTETTVWSTVQRMRADDPRISIGRPIDHTQLVVLDAALRPVPAGVTGEIYIGGKGLARGYLDRPELTAERFVPDPFPIGGGTGRIYRTGDLGRLLHDGRFECLGRLDHQVKIRGFRIELADIESALRSAPGVRDAVVVAKTGESVEPRLLAYFIGGPDRQELYHHARAKLPIYMMPSAFIRVDAFPLTTSGKVDRKALPAAETAVTEPRAGRPPRDSFEQRLASIWAEVLGLPRVGMDENLFALGATSVLIVRTRARLEAELGIELPLRAFFESPTLDDLLKQIAKPQRRSEGFEGLYQLRAGDGQLPVLLVHGDGADQLLPPYLPNEQTLYGYLHQGGEGDRIALDTVESLARRCHDEWLKTCGERPCVIIGHSYGGLIAWHVAHLRRQAGLPVSLLSILDTMHPATERSLRTLAYRGFRRWFGQLRSDYRHLVARLRAERALRGDRKVSLEDRNPYILASYEFAASKYDLPVLDVDVLFFRATEGQPSPDDLDRWRQSTRGELDAVEVAGTHLTAVRQAGLFEPIGHALADRIALLGKHAVRQMDSRGIGHSPATAGGQPSPGSIS